MIDWIDLPGDRDTDWHEQIRSNWSDLRGHLSTLEERLGRKYEEGDEATFDAVEGRVVTHNTTIDKATYIPEGKGSVIAGPLEGEGEITGDGQLTVVSNNGRELTVTDLRNEITDHTETEVHDRPQPPKQHHHSGERLGDEDTPLDELHVKDGEVNRLVGNELIHQRNVGDGETFRIPSGHGSVIAGPLEGEGEITGDGRLKVI